MAAGLELTGWTQPTHPSGLAPHVIYASSSRIVSHPGDKVNLAGFSLPALIKPRGAGPFPSSTDPTDWTWTDPSVPALLNALHIRGYQLVVFGNEMGISTSFNPLARLQMQKSKVELITQALGIPIRFHLSTKQDNWRLPSPEMFHHYEFMLNANKLEIDYTKSFFCGSAAGRKASKGKPADFADWDREFARHAGLHFVVPETAFSPRFLPTLLPSMLLGPPPVARRPPGPIDEWYAPEYAKAWLVHMDRQIASQARKDALHDSRLALEARQLALHEEQQAEERARKTQPRPAPPPVDPTRDLMAAWSGPGHGGMFDRIYAVLDSAMSRTTSRRPKPHPPRQAPPRAQQQKIIPLSSSSPASSSPHHPSHRPIASSSSSSLKTPLAPSLTQPSYAAASGSSSPTKRKRLLSSSQEGEVIDLEEESDIEEPGWLRSVSTGKGKGKGKGKEVQRDGGGEKEEGSQTGHGHEGGSKKKPRRSAVLDSLAGILE